MSWVDDNMNDGILVDWEVGRLGIGRLENWENGILGIGQTIRLATTGL